MKKHISSDWYKAAYTLHMVKEAWTQSTVQDVNFIWKALNLSPGITLLDVACGFGRHAIEFAKRGVRVTGVDISADLINYAKEESSVQRVNINWVCGDARVMDWNERFDVVTNLYDGAIGYSLDDNQNESFFTTLVRALLPGGKHLMHIPNYEYVSKHFPQKCWRSTDSHIELIELDIDKITNYMYETTYYLAYGEVAEQNFPVKESKRVYRISDIERIWSKLGMNIRNVFGGFEMRDPDDCIDDSVVIISQKNQ